jgi:hypothetical protein
LGKFLGKLKKAKEKCILLMTVLSTSKQTASIFDRIVERFETDLFIGDIAGAIVIVTCLGRNLKVFLMKSWVRIFSI